MKIISPNEYSYRIGMAQTILEDLMDMDIPGGLTTEDDRDPVRPLIHEAFHTLEHAKKRYRELISARWAKLDEEDE